MEIKRFEKFDELNVDKIVAKCDHPYAESINYATQFFEDNTELIFLFADDNEYDGDLTWIEKYDLFSIKILNHITFGSTLAKKIKEIIDTKSSFADWLNNQIVRDQLKFDIKICLVKNGYPPQYSPEVFRKVMEQVENFEENLG